MRLRDDFVDDANAGVTRWNRVLERAGVEFRLRLPHVAFNRRIGEFAAIHADADGNAAVGRCVAGAQGDDAAVRR